MVLRVPSDLNRTVGRDRGSGRGGAGWLGGWAEWASAWEGKVGRTSGFRPKREEMIFICFLILEIKLISLGFLENSKLSPKIMEKFTEIP